jgi:hypothetical protein
MIKIDKRNFLEAKRVNKVCISTEETVSYISKEVFLFAQSLVVHVQLAAQVSNMLIKGLLVGS